MLDSMQFESIIRQVGEIGYVTETKYPIAVTNGLPGAKLNELVLFETGDVGYVFSLNMDSVQVAILGRHKIPVSTRVTRTNTKLSFQFRQQGGMIVNPLGDVILGESRDTADPIELPLFVDIPPLVERRNVKKQLITGLSVVDILLPIGQGQRELLVGDRQTGKRPVALQACRSAVDHGLKVVYAMVAQNNSDIHLVYKYFQDHKISEQVHIIATSPLDSPCMIYVTPFSGMSVAEYYAQNGNDVLYIIEDLTTHAQFYREFALVSGRLPGRESYPGDIFYTHAHLLERAGAFSLKGKPETSITCLPMIHTAEGDISTYIATNSIGITDGHLFFDRERYLKGVIPPIHIGLSVTRAGKQTQPQLLRDVNRRLTTFMSEYENTASFSSFGSELSDAVKDVLTKGELYTLFLRQPDANPRELHVDIIFLGMIWQKIFTDPHIDSMIVVRAQIAEFLKGEGAELIKTIDGMKNMDELMKMIDAQKEKLAPLCVINKS